MQPRLHCMPWWVAWWGQTHTSGSANHPPSGAMQAGWQPASPGSDCLGQVALAGWDSARNVQQIQPRNSRRLI